MTVNVLTFIHVRSSSRRIRPAGNRNNTIQQHSRDIYLLKHMLFIFIVFVAGWFPSLIASLPGQSEVANTQVHQNGVVYGTNTECKCFQNGHFTVVFMKKRNVYGPYCSVLSDTEIRTVSSPNSNGPFLADFSVLRIVNSHLF